MNKQPGQPGEEPAEFQFADHRDRRLSADRRHGPTIPVFERRTWRLAGWERQLVFDYPRHWLGLLQAAGETPGTGWPSSCSTSARSPMAKTSGCPGRLKSGFTLTRPARSNSTPSFFVNG